MAKEFPPPPPPPPVHTHTHLNYIIFFNIVHIPDKPGQSHNTQDFESTLSEVRFFFTVPGCLEGWGTLCVVRWGHTYEVRLGSHLVR